MRNEKFTFQGFAYRLLIARDLWWSKLRENIFLSEQKFKP